MGHAPASRSPRCLEDCLEGAPGLVGPNAVTQLRAALSDAVGEDGATALFAAADQERLFDDPPQEMIDERVPARLFRTLFEKFDEVDASAIAFDAGVRTANYVMARRIPGPAKDILKLLPPVLAGPMLMKAVAKNAWTFAGSGDFRVAPVPDVVAEIQNNPLPMPGAVWHVGVFTRLFQALVCAEAVIRHQYLETPDRPTDRFLIGYGKARLGRRCSAGSGAGLRRYCMGCVAR